LKGQRFNLIAVNCGDSAEVINQYIQVGGFTFPIAMGGPGGSSVFRDYRVEVYPTSYLLDERGKIVYRGVGPDEGGLRAALKRLGLEWPIAHRSTPGGKPANRQDF
jgi:hypothetical protein